MVMSRLETCVQTQTAELNKCPWIQGINRFLRTPQYIVLVMLLAAVSNMFAMELVVYGIYVALVAYICLFGSDLLPLIPVVVCCYVAPSVRNNPGREANSVFFSGHGGNVIIVYALVMTAALVYYLIRNRKQFLSQKYSLLSGMLVLSAAYLLSGIGSDFYPAAIKQNLLFALVQGCALVLPYFLIAGGVKWENVRKDYFGWVGFCLGVLVLVQECWIYCTADVVMGGAIERRNVYTGWGMHNNIGSLLATMIPFAFYLAIKYRKGWIGAVVAAAFLGGVILTCSRTSMVMGLAAYAVCLLLMLHEAKNRKHTTIVLVGIVCGIALMFALFYEQMMHLFSDLLRRKLNLSGREDIYIMGWQQFCDRPVFGNSFFSMGDFHPWSTVTAFTDFFPSRWHNTVIQLMASCGSVGLVAYLFHRAQTLRLFLKNRTKETIFIGCAVLVMLSCSLMDCHFFNIGPVLFYSMGLAFAENCYKFS